MHFAGVITEPDPRQATVLSNFGISRSAAATICVPRTLTHIESRIVHFMGHSELLRSTIPGPKADSIGTYQMDHLKRIDVNQQSAVNCSMSALGHKRTNHPRLKSARCSLWSESGQTIATQRLSAKCQTQTFSVVKKLISEYKSGCRTAYMFPGTRD
jgi:hypothetical protein